MLRLGAGRISNQRVTTFAKSGSRFMSELVTAAKVKNSPFDKLDIRPVQRPDTAAYFMAKPKYADLLSGLSQLVSKYPMARYNKSTFKTGRWIKKEGMESKLNIKLTENEYRQLVIRLCEVENVKIEEFEERQLVSMYLNQFRKGYSHVERKKTGKPKARKSYTWVKR
ncbi:hypothetical protein GGI12_003902 [Dipsacomyces acuminosporus]|nr:hypothetical protein GGI12_003902 [Dipsacomyces acuminosporus]